MLMKYSCDRHVLEPTIYFSTNNASINEAFVDW